MANPKSAAHTRASPPKSGADHDSVGVSRPGTGAVPQARAKPAGSVSVDHPDYLDRYLDQLLNEALEETFPASDALAVPTKRDVERR